MSKKDYICSGFKCIKSLKKNGQQNFFRSFYKQRNQKKPGQLLQTLPAQANPKSKRRRTTRRRKLKKMSQR